MHSGVWQIDIMNFHVGCKSLYLTSFLDDHSGESNSKNPYGEKVSEKIVRILNDFNF